MLRLGYPCLVLPYDFVTVTDCNELLPHPIPMRACSVKAFSVAEKRNKKRYIIEFATLPLTFDYTAGGRIDQAHHLTRGKAALEEVVTFNDAIEKAVQLTDQSDTLIVVTADHSHVFTVGGYPSRGNPILGKRNVIDDMTRRHTDMTQHYSDITMT